jgi:hypothetical protein
MHHYANEEEEEDVKQTPVEHGIDTAEAPEMNQEEFLATPAAGPTEVNSLAGCNSGKCLLS